MQLQKFTDQIPSIILERGKDYYKRGAVLDLNQNTQGTWIADVEGNHDNYQVEIETNERGEIEDYYCNCPYDGSICKHIAAVALKLLEESKVDSKKDETSTTKESSWQKLIKNAKAEELRDFIIDYAARDKDLRHEIKLTFSKPESGNKKDNTAYYQSQVAMCFEQYEYHGYIDYRSSYNATHDVDNFLIKAEKHLKKGNYYEVYSIAAAVAMEACEAIQYMDDSSGECGGVIYEAFDLIKNTLEQSNDAGLEEKIFDWLLEQIKNPGYYSYGVGDELEPLFFETAIKLKKIPEAHRLIDSQFKSIENEDGWTKSYRTTEYLKYKIKLFEAEGKHGEVDKLINDNLCLNDFREIRVKQLLEQKNYSEAEKLIKQGIEIAIKDHYPGIEINWNKELLKIYNTTGNVQQQIEVTRWLFKNDTSSSTEHLESLKTFFIPETWPAEQNKLIDWLKRENKYYLFRFYAHEEMYAELFDLLKKHPHFENLKEYGKLLMNDYGDEILQMYTKEIRRMAEIANTRKEYKELANDLKLVKKLKGGAAIVKQLAAGFRETYKRRPAMMEELLNL